MWRLIRLGSLLLGMIGILGMPAVARASAVLAQSAPSCSFVLGFQTLHELIPTIVGGCVDDEHHNPANGDALQHTTGGLLVRPCPRQLPHRGGQRSGPAPVAGGAAEEPLRAGVPTGDKAATQTAL